MLALGVVAIRDSRPHRAAERYSDQYLQSKKVAFVTGFSLALTNPFMIAYWLIGAQLLVHFGLIEKYHTSDIILYLSAGASGIGSYLAVLSLGAYKAKKFFSDRGVQRITVALGITLLAVSTYFIAQAVLAFTSNPEHYDLYETIH